MPYPQEFAALANRVNNWGRWGADDEVGTINLVTADVRREAARCVRSGRAFSLALPLSLQDGIQTGAVPGRIDPIRTMIHVNTPIFGDPEMCCVNDDIVMMALQAATHWDALSHVSYRGRIYNGYPADTVTASGAARCGIAQIDSLVSRGVLLDVPRALGIDRLAPGQAVGQDELDAACELAKVDVRAGDIVLIRTGHAQHLLADPPDKIAYGIPSPGLGMSACAWFHARDVAAITIDTFALEVVPGEDDEIPMPVHVLHLVEMGLTQGQNWMLEALADDCADDGIYDFLLSASPEPFVNAVGSPVNPIAVK